MNGTRLRSRRARTGGRRRRIEVLKGDGVATDGSEFTSVNGEAPDGCPSRRNWFKPDGRRSG
jgi:hypothetical protein